MAAAAVIIMLWLLAWVMFSATHQKPIETPKKITTTTTTTLEKVETTTSVAGTTPTTLKTEKKNEVRIESHSGTGPIRVVQGVLCKGLVNNSPQETARDFAVGDVVYFWTAVEADSVPQTIEHVWINPAGQTYFKIDLNVARSQAGTWSRITLQPGDEGTWKVRTMADEKILSETQFKVGK